MNTITLTIIIKDEDYLGIVDIYLIWKKAKQ